MWPVLVVLPSGSVWFLGGRDGIFGATRGKMDEEDSRSLCLPFCVRPRVAFNPSEQDNERMMKRKQRAQSRSLRLRLSSFFVLSRLLQVQEKGLPGWCLKERGFFERDDCRDCARVLACLLRLGVFVFFFFFLPFDRSGRRRLDVVAVAASSGHFLLLGLVICAWTAFGRERDARARRRLDVVDARGSLCFSLSLGLWFGPFLCSVFVVVVGFRGVGGSLLRLACRP